MASELGDNVRAELRKQGVKLWLPPYTPPADGALQSLAHSFAASLSLDEGDIAASLEELRQHAVAKLKARTRVTLAGKVVGAARLKELRSQFDTADTGAQVRQVLLAQLGVAELRIISCGKSLQDEPTLGAQGWPADQDRGGLPLKVLVFASGTAPSDTPSGADVPAATPAGDAADVKGLEAGGSAAAAEPPPAAAPCPVAVIREAAESLTAEGFGDFEVSDAATGRLVPIPPAARQALVAALALHARGREMLRGGGDASAVEALQFLVEADQSFEKCRAGGAGQLLEQLENFGQLQLDICWAYAVLGNSENLPDAEVRLGAAERMIRRQVDKNFLTLAEVQAEQGHTLPPETIPCMRLWLLRGIARRLRGDAAGARADLERAQLFLQALHIDQESLGSLLLLGATRQQAVAAMRRCGGSVDRAADALLAAAPRREAEAREREAQRKLGHTADGSLLDVHMLEHLTGMGFDRKLASAALKQSNNDVAGALEALQTQSSEALLGKHAPKAEAVDEMALATLLSLGFEEKQVEKALRAVNNNVEEAIMALTAQQAAAEAGETGASDAADSPEAVAAAEESGKRKDESDTEARPAKRRALDEARQVVERELGQALRRTDLDDDTAGASLEHEEMLLQQHLYSL